MQVDLFKKFLFDSKRVSPDEIEDYALWVYRFLTLKLPLGLSNEEKISAFGESLSLDTSLDDEQCAQAKYALWSYLNDFLGDDNNLVTGKQRDNYLLLDTLRGFLQLKKYSDNTIKVYVDWVSRYADFCSGRECKTDSADCVTEFLKNLEDKGQVSPSTRNQALNALSFMFVNVFDEDLNHIKTSARVKTERQLPDILTVDELKNLFEQVAGTERLMLKFIYGTGVTISEFGRVRVNAIDFENREIAVFDDNTFDERTVPMPGTLVESLRSHLAELKELHTADLEKNQGATKFTPEMTKRLEGQEKEWKWQFIFPSKNLTVDNETGAVYRDQLAGRTIQLIMKKAVEGAGIEKKASVHTLRHSYATHLLMNGVSIQDVQKLLGHKNIETTMIYNQILKKNFRKPVSPLDLM